MWENAESTVVFPIQKRLHERASMFRSTYIANLVNSAKIRKDRVLRFSTSGRLGIGNNTAKLQKVSHTNLSVISA
jgi:NADH/NAD ratio-sensing transcriptional regulator Rex